ncbi:unnamed protein product [Cylindrotheca closterium]|uniref:Uncharacterized protein n=1 Tax=Cylindrotheca closterium TaxID=2856 RepID=A0AAD2CQK3_9STRA|nr:unnamed protein product [Cylindrotheca closterium]
MVLRLTISRNRHAFQVAQKHFSMMATRRKPSLRRGCALRLQSSSPQPPEKRNWPLLISVLTIPTMFLAWGASDSIFGNRQIGENNKLREEFLANPMERQRDEDLPVICFCVVRRVSKGNHCLVGVQLADVVEVLAEGVGPQRQYNLCRLPANPDEPLSTDVYGWFPTRNLQKLDDYHRMVQAQKKLLGEDKEGD